MLGESISAKSKSSKESMGTSRPGSFPRTRRPRSVSIVQTQFIGMIASALCFLKTDSKSHSLVNAVSCSTEQTRGSIEATLRASR